jgi:indolepyruvate ferredoxin oxidoreductase
VFINEAVCEGCGDCSTKSNCLSVLPIHTEFGEKRAIHDPSCNRDYTCIDGDCPSFVTIEPRATGRHTATPSTSRPRPTLPTGTLPDPTAPPVGRQFGIYFTGIGGTGVVTANRLLAAAADETGLVVGGMDQTGLSQKAGAVVSHLHLAPDADSAGAASVSDLGADLYLSGDLLQAAADRHLDKVRPGHTIAVVDTTVTPTPTMLQTDAAPPDPAMLERRVAERVGVDRVVLVASKDIAERVFANPLLANVVLLGAAYQRGGLPLPFDAMDRAIEAGGHDSAATREAFAWGRWAAHDPDAVAARIVADDQARPRPLDPSAVATTKAARLLARRRLPHELDALLSRRTAQVIDYQSPSLGSRYLELIEVVAGRDDAGHDWELTKAVAASWFKLLTYKDEYEVARLHLAQDYDEVAADLGIEGGYELTFHLHPPVLRRLGLKRKLPLGRTYELAFHALRGMRRLRGTSLDPFGLDPDRRAERALIEEYEQLVDDVTRPGSAIPYDDQLALVASALAIKGYGPIKERAIDAWRDQVTQLRRVAPAGTA